MKNSMSELFPGCEAFMEDVEINNNVTVPTEEDTEQAEEAGVVAGETQAAEAAEIESEATESEAAATAFARQFNELCNMQTHIETYGVDRTFLALCNRDNILGRAFGIQMPACESFDTVGSPYSPLSIACVEAMGDGMWEKFKEWVKTVWMRIKNFFIKIADWFREMLGNYNLRLNKYKKWVDEHRNNAVLLNENNKISDKEVLLPVAGTRDYAEQYNKVCSELQKELFNNKEWQDCVDNVNDIVKAAVSTLIQRGNKSVSTTRDTVETGSYNGSGIDGSTRNGFSAYDPTEKQTKATEKLLEKIEELKKKIKKDDLWKKKKVKISAAFKDSKTPEEGGKKAIDQMDKLLESLTSLIKRNEEFERVRDNFSKSVSQNMDKLNSEIQRTTGGSIGANSRKLVNNNVTHIEKVVFKSGIVPTLNNKMIKEGFQSLGMLRDCLTTKDNSTSGFSNR